MTGTGTQSDPYIITTIEELKEQANISGVYLKLANDLNFNDEPSVLGNGITVNCKEIDGDGYALLNAIITSCLFDIRSASGFKNLGIKNVYADVNGANISIIANNYIYSGMYFTNCFLTGLLSNQTGRNYASITTNNIVFKNSGINMIFNGNNVFTHTSGDYGGFTLDNSNMEIRGTSSTNLSFTLQNSYITGFVPNLNIYVRNNSNNSIIDVEATSYTSDSNVGITLANSSKISGTISQYLKPVTPEQLADTEYLSSIGFPIEINQIGG